MNVIWFPFGRLLAAIRFIILIGTMALIIGLGLLMIKLGIGDQRFAFKIRTVWCRFALKLLGIRLHVSGNVDLTEGTLFVGNHRTFIDPILAFSFIDNGYAISKSEVSGYPLIHTGAKLTGVIYVQRNDTQSRHHVKDCIAEYLQQNKSILIFPEGTTSIDKNTLPFKKGSFEAAATAGKPIVVFAIEMGNPKKDFWYKDGLLSQYFITYSKIHTDIYIHFFEPIRGNSGEALCLQSQQMVNIKLMEFQKNWKNNGENKHISI